MHWVLGRLRGRLGFALVLTLLVLGTIGIGRALGGAGSGSGSQLSSGKQVLSTAVPSGPEDGVEDGPTVPTRQPSLRPGADGPQTVAGKFLRAWLDSQLSPRQWHAGIEPYATAALADKLSGVDPVGVPAERTTGEPTLVPRGSGSAMVSVPVDSGTVELRLIVVDGRWLVDGVDWSRA